MLSFLYKSYAMVLEFQKNQQKPLVSNLLFFPNPLTPHLTSFPGGHSLYLEARNKFEQDYKLVPRKGVKVRSNRIGKEQQIRVKGSLLVHLVARS